MAANGMKPEVVVDLSRFPQRKEFPSTNTLFIEKYRPKTFEEYFVSDPVVQRLIDTAKTKPIKLPNLILHSSAGTGKTTFVRALIREMNAEDNTLTLEGSSSGIDTIRGIVTEFVKTRAQNPNLPKFIHFEEASNVTPAAQDALKQIIEDSSKTCRFIFTCNEIEKMREPVISRCQMVNFGNPDPDKIRQRLLYVCSCESDLRQVPERMVDDIIDVCYPDVRKMLVALEMYVTLGMTEFEATVNAARTIYGCIATQIPDAAIAVASRRDIDQRTVLRLVYRDIMRSPAMSDRNKRTYVSIICEADYRMAVGTLREFAFMAAVMELTGYAV